MKRFYTVFLFMLFIAPLTSWAQERVLSGRVAGDDGSPLPGASVLLKGTTTGTSTDNEGRFRLRLPAAGGTIQLSFVGFINQELAIGNQTDVSITLKADASQLNEVVVTALGITRDKKSLGFSQQSIGGSAVSEVRPSNVANALSGKVAGLRIQSNSSPGSGSTIQLRGASSITNNNSPLIVIDGVPIEQASQNKRLGGGIQEVNPENIKDISVLKGPAAAALYGSRAQNGAILITTKNGSGTKGIGVEVGTNFTAENVWIAPQLQNTYGGGNGYRTWYSNGRLGTAITDPLELQQYRAAYGPLAPATSTDGTDESWGAPMDGRLVRQWFTGTAVAPLTPKPNNFRDYFQTGTTFSNNIAISGGNDKGSFRLSLGRLDQKGVMYFSDYHRNNFKFNSAYNFTPKLSVTISAEYIKSGGLRGATSNTGQFIWGQRSVDWNQIRNWRDYVGINIQRQVAGKPADNLIPNWQYEYWSNPYYSGEKLTTNDDKDRMVGNIALNYKILPELNLMVRSGTDYWSQTVLSVNNYERVANGVQLYGGYGETVSRSQETNTDAILTYNKSISPTFSLNATAGALIRTNTGKTNGTTVAQLVVDGLYNLSNSIPSQNTASSSITRRESQSVFGALNLGWRNMIFLDVTARNDWSSTLPSVARSFFYPSAALSAVVTDIVPNLKSDVLSFLKARGSIAQVGNDAGAYQLYPTFTAATSWNGSVAEFAESTQKPNNLLKPEQTTATEFGVEARFLQGRVSFDATYYDQTTKNQIISVQLSKASGYNSSVQNVGKMQNKGIELTLSGTPLKLKNGFTWETSFNFARNRNKVIELIPGVLNNLVITTANGMLLEARAGQPYGDFYGNNFARVQNSDPTAAYYDPSGKYAGQLVMNASGQPFNTSTQKVLGNVQPKWTGGFSNTFSWKGVVVSALIDMRMGGSIYDQGTAIARWTGQMSGTDVGREEGVIGKGVQAVATTGTDGKTTYAFTPNTVISSGKDYYAYNNARTYHEAAIFDASYVKLREVSIGYQIPSTFIHRFGMQSMKFSLVGRNVAMLFKNTANIDPEVDANGGNAQGFTYGELPSTRSMGFNLNFGF